MFLERRHLEALAALRDRGSLSAAADQLHLTASALSHQMLSLEERAGARFFLRKTRPVQFTAVGQRLLALADDILPKVREAERDLIRLAGIGEGRLHIAIECHSCYQWLMPTLARYRLDWPEVALDLSAGFNFDALPALVRGELDMVITSDPRQRQPIVYFPLFQHEVVLAVPRQHPLVRKGFVEPQDLAGETLVTYPVDRDRLDIFNSFLDPAGVVPAGTRTAELTVMILQLVASGRGVAMMPNWALAEAGPGDSVVGVRVGQEGKFGTLYAATTTPLVDKAYLQDFLRTARETSFATLRGISAVAVATAAPE